MRTIIVALLVLLAAQSAMAQVPPSALALSGPLHYLEDPVLIPILPPEEAAAQNPVVLVLGVGNLVMEVPLPVATAQAQTYYAYIDDRAKQTLTVTCTLKSGQTAVSLCPTPLSAMNLTDLHHIEIATAVTAADGIKEGPRVAVPFDLRKMPDPVPITPAPTSVQPTPPPQ